ncbi:MAG: hypothetical protein U0Y68_15705 [Blastocatellia bacterium]
MLNQPTLNALRTLKLIGMAEAFAQQLEQPATQQLAFDERFACSCNAKRPTAKTGVLMWSNKTGHETHCRISA